MVCCVAVPEHAAAHHAYAHTTCTARRSRKNARTQCIFDYVRVPENVSNDMQRDRPHRRNMANTLAKKLVQGISDGLRNQEQDRGRGNGYLRNKVYDQGYNIGQALREEVEGQLHAATIQYTDRINEIIRETKTRFKRMKQLETDLKKQVKQVHEAMRKSVKKGEEVTVVIKESAGQMRLRV